MLSPFPTRRFWYVFKTFSRDLTEGSKRWGPWDVNLGVLREILLSDQLNQMFRFYRFSKNVEAMPLRARLFE